MQNGKLQIEDIFSEAWQRVVTGDSVDVVISTYPDHAAELEPMLRVASAMRAMPQPAPTGDALARIQQRTQSAAQERAGARQGASPIVSTNGRAEVAYRPQRKSWLAYLLSSMPVP